LFAAHAAFTPRGYAAAVANVRLPEISTGRVHVELYGSRIHAPAVSTRSPTWRSTATEG